MDDHNLLHPAGSDAAQQQDWGRLIVIGLVALGILVLVSNMLAYKPQELSLGPDAQVTVPQSWLRAGQVGGVLFGLGGGGWLLWHLLRHKQARGQAHLDAQLQKAVQDARKIEALLGADAREPQQQLLVGVRTWKETAARTVQALARLDQNMFVSDLDDLSAAVAGLERQLAEEPLPPLRADLEQALQQYRKQLEVLEQSQIARRRAELQVERGTAVLGTLYAQLLTRPPDTVDCADLIDILTEETQRLQSCLEILHGQTPHPRTTIPIGS